MIKINHLTISFHEKIILKEVNFEATNTQLTVLQGESGAGKSTFIDALLFQHPCTYIYNGKNLSLCNEILNQQFIMEKIGIVYQLPSFLPNLTIQDQCSMIKEIHKIPDEINEYVALLGIEQMLQKFPSQLSGGEKTRAACYMALLKKPEILILDEPTASLDQENKIAMINLLKHYAHEQQAIVIVATHDKILMEQADVLYEIKNQQVTLEKGNVLTGEAITLNQSNVLDFSKLKKYVKKARKHVRLYYKAITLLLGFAIGFLVLSSALNNASIAHVKAMLNEFSTNEVFVYKPAYSDQSFSFSTSEYPITSTELEMITTIKGVERVEWRFNTSISGLSTIYSTPENENELLYNNSEYSEKLETISAFDGNREVASIRNGSIFQNTYIDDYDYGKVIKTTFHSSGIYVSQTLYEELFPDTVQDPYLRFQMMVPLYDSSGVASIPDIEDESIIIPINYTACQPVEVVMPIKGVLQGNVLSHEEYYAYQIYVSQNDLLTYINKQEVEDQRMVYYSEETALVYFSSLPEGIKSSQTVEQTRWTPNVYSVIVDDLEHMSYVISELKRDGFDVTSNYFHTQTVLDAKESVKQTMTIVSSIFIFIVLLLYAFIKFIHKKIDKEGDRFLTMIGMNHKQRLLFHSLDWRYQWQFQVMVAIIFFLICRWYIMKMNIATIRLEPGIFVKIILLSFVAECIIPYILRIKRRG